MSLLLALLTVPVTAHQVMFDKDKFLEVTAVGKNLLEVKWRHALLGDVKAVKHLQVYRAQ